MQDEVSVGSYEYDEAVIEDEVSEVGEGEDDVDDIYGEESFEEAGNVKSKAYMEPAGEGYGDDFDEEDLEEEQSAEPLPAATAVPSANTSPPSSSKDATASNTCARAASSVDVEDDDYSVDDLVFDKENNTPHRAMASEDDGYGEDFDDEDDNGDVQRGDVSSNISKEPTHKQALSPRNVDDSRPSAGAVPLPAAVPLQQQQSAAASKAPKNPKSKASKKKTPSMEPASTAGPALPNTAQDPTECAVDNKADGATANGATSINDGGSSVTQIASTKPRSILKKSTKVETAAEPAFDYLGPAAEDYWSGNAAANASAAQPEVGVYKGADAGDNANAGANDDSPRDGASVRSSKSGKSASSVKRNGLGKGFVPPPLVGRAGSAGQARSHSASKDRSASKAAANGAVVPGVPSESHDSGKNRRRGSKSSVKRPQSAPGLRPYSTSGGAHLPDGGMEQARQDVLNSMLAKRVADLEWQVAQQAAELVAQSPGRPAGNGSHSNKVAAGRATQLAPGSLTAAAPYYGGQHLVQEAVKVAVHELNSDPNLQGRTAKFTRQKLKPWRVNGSNPQASTAAAGSGAAGASSDILFGAAPSSRSPKHFLQAPQSWEGSGPWAEDAAARTAQWKKASQGKKRSGRKKDEALQGGARDENNEDVEDSEEDNNGHGERPASNNDEGLDNEETEGAKKKKKKRKKKKKHPAPGWERFLEVERFSETAAVRTTSPIRSSGKRATGEPQGNEGTDDHKSEGGAGGEDGKGGAPAADVPVGVTGVKEMRRSMPSPYVYDTHGHKVLTCMRIIEH